MKVDILDLEVNSGDLSFLFGKEVAFGEPPEESSLSDITVSDQDKFVLLLLPVR